MLVNTGQYAPTVIHGRSRAAPTGDIGAKSCYRLVCVVDGRLQIKIAGEAFVARPGDVYLIPPDTDYHCKGHAESRLAIVSFTVMACRLKRSRPGKQPLIFDQRRQKAQPQPNVIWGRSWPRRLPDELAAFIYDSAVHMAAIWWRNDDLHFEANQRLVFALGHIARHVKEHESPRQSTPATDHVVGRVLDVIHEHYAALKTAADIARHIGISVSRMDESFRQAIGETPMANLRRYRLAMVEHLLLTSEAEIRMIAEMTGFTNAKTLHKAWMKSHDLPPLKWRRLHRYGAAL